MASFPDSIFSPASKNTGDTIQASHVTDLDSEVVAIEGGLRNGTAPLNSSNSTFTALSVSGNSTLTGSVTCSSLLTVPAQPRCHVLSTAAVVVSTTVFTAFTFESQEFNVGSMHSTSANSSRVTIGSSGTYLIAARAFKASGGSTSGNMYVSVNGANIIGHHYGTAQPVSLQITTTRRLQATDQLTLGVVPNDATATTFGDGSSALATRLEAVRLY